jgi:hypothetical protein
VSRNPRPIFVTLGDLYDKISNVRFALMESVVFVLRGAARSYVRLLYEYTACPSTNTVIQSTSLLLQSTSDFGCLMHDQSSLTRNLDHEILKTNQLYLQFFCSIPNATLILRLNSEFLMKS